MNESVIIIGGGIVGCLTAIELKKKDYKITIIESSQIGQGSSSAAAGILYPLLPWKYDDEIYDYCKNASEYYKNLSELLIKETKIEIDYINSGLLILPSFDQNEIIKWSEKNQIKVSKTFFNNQEAILIPNIAQIDPNKLLRALKVYLLKIGIKILENTEVKKILSHDDNLNSVETKNDCYHANYFILSAGAWSNLLYSNLPKKIKPIRGQIIQYQQSEIKLNNILYSDGMYILQRKDKRIIAGSTLEDIGFSKKNLKNGVRKLDEKAKSILNSLKKLNIENSWYGYRPGVIDNKPIIEQNKKLKNLYVHSGHFRYGITMAPKTTQLLLNLFNL